MTVQDALSPSENILEVRFQPLNITKGFRTVLQAKEKKQHFQSRQLNSIKA